MIAKISCSFAHFTPPIACLHWFRSYSKIAIQHQACTKTQISTRQHAKVFRSRIILFSQSPQPTQPSPAQRNRHSIWAHFPVFRLSLRPAPPHKEHQKRNIWPSSSSQNWNRVKGFRSASPRYPWSFRLVLVNFNRIINFRKPEKDKLNRSRSFRVHILPRATLHYGLMGNRRAFFCNRNEKITHPARQWESRSHRGHELSLFLRVIVWRMF